VLPRIRYRLARFVSWALGRIFRRARWRSLLVYGLDEGERRALVLEAARGLPLDAAQGKELVAELAPPARPALARAALSSLEGAALEAAFAHARELVEEDQKAAPHALRSVAAYRAMIESAGGLRDRRILELGPGFSLAPGLLLVASGAASYVGADAFPIASREPEHYRGVRRELERDRAVVRPDGLDAERRRMLERFDELCRFGPSGVDFDARVAWRCPVDVASLPFDAGAFDLVISVSTFEHFPEPARAIAECFRVLAPGGVAIHQIDLRDHRDFSRPFEFLCEDAASWRRRFEPGSPGARSPFELTNRWRRSELVAAFGAAGFERVEARVAQTERLPDDVRRRLHPDFRYRPSEDLETLGIIVVAHRPILEATGARVP
jgi:SAM-dependent methyltransferase